MKATVENTLVNATPEEAMEFVTYKTRNYRLYHKH